MMINVARYLIPFLFLMTVITLFVTVVNRYISKSNFSCTASFVLHSTDSLTSMSVNYVFDRNEGYVNLMGKMDEKGKVSHPLSRKIFFNYKRSGENYYLTSRNTLRSLNDTIDDDKLLHLFPSFFVKPGKELFINIREQKGEQYLFFMDPIPVYLCKKN